MSTKSTILSFKLLGSPDQMAKQLKDGEQLVIQTVNKLIESTGGQRWNDPDFGPRSSDPKGARAIYRGARRSRDSMPDPARIVWLRPNYIGRPKIKSNVLCEDASLFKGGHCSGDVIQGQLGDCWYISALAMIANENGLLDDLFFTGVRGRRFQEKENSAWLDAGIWVVRFCSENTFNYVIIDDQFPCSLSEPEKLLFGRCEDISELWVPIAEKAYAKLMGSYDSLNGGFSQIALRDITGLCPEAIDINDKTSKTPYVDKKLLNYLTERIEWSSLLGASCENISGGVGEGKGAQGLITGHAYSLLGLLPIKTPEGNFNLVVLRNPWGSGEWKGTWSDKCPKKKKYLNLIKKAWSDRPVKRRKNIYSARGRTTVIEDDIDMFEDIDNGIFLMEFLDFQKYFSEVIACVDFPDQWRGRRVLGEWDKKNSGGNSSLTTWRINPAFKLTISKNNTRVLIRLDQEDKRAKFGVDFADKIYAVAFRIVPSNFAFGKAGNAPPRVIPNLVENRDQIKYAYCESCTVDLKMNKGDVYIVPSTYNVGESGLFSLSVYCDAQDFVLEGSEIIGQEEQREPMVHRGHFNVDLGFDALTFFKTRREFHERLQAKGIDHEDIAEAFSDVQQSQNIIVNYDQFLADLTQFGVTKDLVNREQFDILCGEDHVLHRIEYYPLFHNKSIYKNLKDEDKEALRLKWNEIRHNREGLHGKLHGGRGGRHNNSEAGRMHNMMEGLADFDGENKDVNISSSTTVVTDNKSSTVTNKTDNKSSTVTNKTEIKTSSTIITDNKSSTISGKTDNKSSTVSNKVDNKSSSTITSDKSGQSTSSVSSSSSTVNSKSSTVVTDKSGHTCNTQTNVVQKSSSTKNTGAERRITPAPFPPPPYVRRNNF